MLRSFAVFAVALAWTGASLTFAQEARGKDRKFLMEAYRSGMKSAEMGRLGVTRGTASDLKAFAQREIDDHAKTNEELLSLAERKNVDLPIDDPINSEGFGDGAGPGFDAHFAKMAVEDQKKEVEEFEKEAKSGADPELKQWAAEVLPALREQLEAAKGLRD
jgi:putative membrane protein